MSKTEYHITTDEYSDEIMALKYYEDIPEKPKLSCVAIRDGVVIGAVSIFPRDDLVTMAPISTDSPIVAFKMVDKLEKTLIKLGLTDYYVPVDIDSPIRESVEKFSSLFTDKLYMIDETENVHWYRRILNG